MYIFQLSWGGASPLLSDKEKYPRFFRVAAPDTRYNFARIALARLYKWRKIATLNVAMDYFSAVSKNKQGLLLFNMSFNFLFLLISRDTS